MKKEVIINQGNIKDKIHIIRGLQVMLDRDLAGLYGVPTKRLNEQVKRNIERFPEDFMFQLTKEEAENLMFQNGTSNNKSSLRFQFRILKNKQALRSQNATLETEQALRSHFVTLNTKRGKHRKYMPYVFTEQGVAALSGILKSKKAVEVNIQVIRAFVAMRRFISKNAELFMRLDNVERKQLKYDKNFEKIFNAIENKQIKTKQGIFFNGQIFDAYSFISDLIRNANNSIILIDNYIDDSVLIFFSKRKKNISVTIYTKTITKQLQLDLDKFNSQYPVIDIKAFKDSHDRFMIIDNKEVYHFGASLKDLGKKWFAFSKFDKEACSLLEKL